MNQKSKTTPGPGSSEPTDIQFAEDASREDLLFAYENLKNDWDEKVLEIRDLNSQIKATENVIKILIREMSQPPKWVVPRMLGEAR